MYLIFTRAGIETRLWLRGLKRNLEFQDPATAPRPKWFLIFAWAMDARGYMDDLMIYEGEDPISLAVEPTAKLATLWDDLKKNKLETI